MARVATVPRRAGGGAPDPFDHPSTLELVARGLAEDVGRGDVTTAATVAPGATGRTALVAREDCVVAGLPLVAIVLEAVAGRGRPVPSVSIRVAEGKVAGRGRTLAVVDGSLAVTLTAERLLLNLVQHLCGIATETRRYVAAVAGTGASIVDTRKTLPGLRLLQKYAVRCGGGRNHRFGLDDGVLVKDNHIAACGSVAAAIRAARDSVPHSLKIEVECERMAQVEAALRAGADAILLDNMTPREVRAAVHRIGGRAIVEVSGGVSLDTVRAYAESGADIVSIGRLTHSVRAVDVGLDFLSRQSPRTGPRGRTPSRRGR